MELITVALTNFIYKEKNFYISRLQSSNLYNANTDAISAKFASTFVQQQKTFFFIKKNTNTTYC